MEMMNALRKTKIKINGKLAYRYRKNKNENEIIFLANGFQDSKGIKMICEGYAVLRQTSNWLNDYRCVVADLQEKRFGFSYSNVTRLSIRLVKDNPNFKGKKTHHIVYY